MGLTTTNATNILKVRYIGPIREQLNNATPLLARIGREDNAISMSGKSWTVPLHTGRNLAAGIGRAEATSAIAAAALPTAGQQGYDVAIIPNTYQYGRIQLTGPVIKATRDNAGAFVKAIESEMQGLLRDTRKSQNRQLHGDGADALAFWTTADNSTPTPVDDGRGNNFIHLPLNTAVTCDLIDASDNSSVLGDSIVVTVTASGATLSAAWSGTVTGSADGDYLVLEDTLGRQMMGIGGIISASDPPVPSGGLHGLPVATKPWWSAQVFSNSGTNRSLTLPLMQAPLSAIATNSDYTEEDVKFLLCSYGIRDKYYDLLISEKRFVNVMKLDGGFTGLEFSGIPLVPDPQCKKNRIYYICPESMKIYRTSDWDWMDNDGSMFNRVEGYDAYEATLFAYQNLGCTVRNANALLDDITE